MLLLSSRNKGLSCAYVAFVAHRQYGEALSPLTIQESARHNQYSLTLMQPSHFLKSGSGLESHCCKEAVRAVPQITQQGADDFSSSSLKFDPQALL